MQHAQVNRTNRIHTFISTRHKVLVHPHGSRCHVAVPCEADAPTTCETYFVCLNGSC